MSTENAVEVTPEILPKIVHEGRYRLYELPGGGLHLVYKIDGSQEGEERHFELPPVLMELAQSAANGDMNPMQMMAKAAQVMMAGGLPFPPT